ncbi:hypothetical protein SH661x_002098 [Planctomicrobium sp. SH661]
MSSLSLREMNSPHAALPWRRLIARTVLLCLIAAIYIANFGIPL